MNHISQSTSLSLTLATHLKLGMRVLDLGAGEGKHAKMFLEAGGRVTAVDRRGNGVCEPGIDWRSMGVEKFIAECPEDEMFDLIFIQNLIHFLPIDWVLAVLLPWVNRHTAPGGLVAIRTFTQSPVPAYKEELSYYTPGELRDAFLGWEKIVSETVETFVNGHDFFFLDRAARKPPVT